MKGQFQEPNIRVILTVAATLVLILALFYLLFQILQPFFFIFLTAFVLTVLLNPVFEYVHLRKGKGEMVSAGLTILFFLTIVSIPLLLVATLLAREVSDILAFVQTNYSTRNELTATLFNNLHSLGINAENLEMEIDKYAVTALKYLSANLSVLLSQTAGVILDSLLTILVTFYFLIHKDAITEYFLKINPLKSQDTEKLVARAREVITATIRGNLYVIAIQTAIGIAGFTIFGLPSPVLLGAIYGVCSIIPMVGIAIVWIPSVAFLMVIGNIPAAVGLAAWCFGSNIFMDNFIGPKVISGDTELHPILILFGVLGGVQLFGFFGIIIGPTIIALSLVAVEMLQELIETH